MKTNKKIMTKTLCDKLHTRRGVTMVAALLLMLLVAILVTVVLSAASANVSRMQDDRSSRQARLSVSSAVNMLSNGIESLSYSYVCYSTDTGTPACGETTTHGGIAKSLIPTGCEFSVDYDRFTESSYSTGIKSLLKNNIEPAIVDRRAGTGTVTSCAFTISADGFTDVKVDMTIDSDYNIIFTLSAEGAATTVVTFNAVVDKSHYTNPVERSCTHSYVTQNTNGEDVDKECTVTVSEKSLYIYWNCSPEVSEIQ